MTDQEHADAIEAALRKLGTALDGAWEAGLTVLVDFREYPNLRWTLACMAERRTPLIPNDPPDAEEPDADDGFREYHIPPRRDENANLEARRETWRERAGL